MIMTIASSDGFELTGCLVQATAANPITEGKAADADAPLMYADHEDITVQCSLYHLVKCTPTKEVSHPHMHTCSITCVFSSLPTHFSERWIIIIRRKFCQCAIVRRFFKKSLICQLISYLFKKNPFQIFQILLYYR